MTTKYGYKLTNNNQVIAEAWGFESEVDARTDAVNTFKLPNGNDSLEVFETTHRNYFGKQFKQVSCKRIN